MTTDPRMALRRLPLFKELSGEAADLVADRLIHRAVPPGTILFRRGEPARGLYLLTKGAVEIYRSAPNGREQVLHTEIPVQSVAELPVFDGGAYPASARTAEASELFFLSLDDFRRLYREHPEISDAVIRNLGRRLRKLVGVVEKISLRSVPARVARTLLEAAEASGTGGDGFAFRLERTQTELAQELATTRESVARALGEMRRSGIISTEGRRVTIHSMEALSGVAESS